MGRERIKEKGTKTVERECGREEERESWGGRRESMTVGETVLKVEIGAEGGRGALERDGGKEKKEQIKTILRAKHLVQRVDEYIIHKY